MAISKFSKSSLTNNLLKNNNVVGKFNIEYLVVAGGGSGGIDGGGGGGAGGLRYSSSYEITRGITYTVTVGAGGTGPTGYSQDQTGSGNNSSFGSIYSVGGGAGTNFRPAGDGYAPHLGGHGGSGGGGGGLSSSIASNGGQGIAGQGYRGGNGVAASSVSWDSAGGGGAGGAGVSNGANTGGNGGVGLEYSITGTATFYAGGGGGANEGGTTPGTGGNGGGGTGGSNSNTQGGNGTANTGGGAGGSDNTTDGGDGGSGIVVIAYPNSYPALTIGSGLTYNEPSRSGWRVYRFTAGTGTVTF
jgi:hypothetical protein